MPLTYPLCTTCYIVAGDRLANERIAYFLCKRQECHCKCGHGGDSLRKRADAQRIERVSITPAGREALASCVA